MVTTVLNAYQQGDYESMKPYLDEDSKFHPMLAAVTAENATAMDKVYQEAYALTKNFTYTAEAVEGEEKWGHVKVHIQTNNIVSGISDSMAEAIAEQVKNGGDSFYDVPTWLMAGLKSGEAVDEEFVVTVTLINKEKNDQYPNWGIIQRCQRRFFRIHESVHDQMHRRGRAVRHCFQW